MEDGLYTNWYDNQTVVHPVGLSALLVLGIATLVVPRRYALVPTLIMACIVPPAQRVVVAGLDFHFMRLMALFGWLRVLIRGEIIPLRLHALDILFTASTAATNILYTINHGSPSAFVTQLGFSFDALGFYFLGRLLLRGFADIERLAAATAVISLPVVVLFLWEGSTGRNLFSVFGGVPEYTNVRDGTLRCQGAFPHSILAGVFWAALMPLIASRWWIPGCGRLLTASGLLACLIIVFSTGSSTPLAAVALAIFGGLMFYARRYMRPILWCGFGVAAFLHFAVMDRGIWHLFARIPMMSGSYGWHRFNVLDKFFANWDEWILVGTTRTAHWGVVDITNQFVSVALEGGIVNLALFIAVWVVAFRQVGAILRRVKGSVPATAVTWAVGVTLLLHVVVLNSTQYFGQIVTIWFLSFAMVGSLAETRAPRRQPRPVPPPEPCSSPQAARS